MRGETFEHNQLYYVTGKVTYTRRGGGGSIDYPVSEHFEG